MNEMPVTNQREREQKKGDQQQSSGFRSINRVIMLLVRRIGLGLYQCHEDIVALLDDAIENNFRSADTRG